MKGAMIGVIQDGIQSVSGLQTLDFQSLPTLSIRVCDVSIRIGIENLAIETGV